MQYNLERMSNRRQRTGRNIQASHHTRPQVVRPQRSAIDLRGSKLQSRLHRRSPSTRHRHKESQSRRWQSPHIPQTEFARLRLLGSLPQYIRKYIHHHRSSTNMQREYNAIVITDRLRRNAETCVYFIGTILFQTRHPLIIINEVIAAKVVSTVCKAACGTVGTRACLCQTLVDAIFIFVGQRLKQP